METKRINSLMSFYTIRRFITKESSVDTIGC